ncbi:hypothetical protein [Planococcus lenghuensis]|uniref:Uncharacterized protein n=1 Tax=Planococcus lenghuensis TaxID=2213202 RepID=A0A1Q2L0S0_9BACL|nr:hypothetical protein [Planococcus lenghuensis]AQQ53492.1 hypothetical protein B0X71_10685 [Planococcus lenghuensis]
MKMKSLIPKWKETDEQHRPGSRNADRLVFSYLLLKYKITKGKTTQKFKHNIKKQHSVIAQQNLRLTGKPIPRQVGKGFEKGMV